MSEVGILQWSTIDFPIDPAAHRTRFGSRLRRVGPYVQAAQLGAARVLDPLTPPPKDVFLALGTGLANLATIVPLIRSISHPTHPRCSPMAFARSVGNSAAFYVAQAFELSGANITVSQEELSFEAALYEGWLAVRTGECQYALVGGLDVVYDDDEPQLTRLGAHKIEGHTAAGCAFVLLGPGGDWVLDQVKVGRFSPLDDVPDGATVLRGWRAQAMTVPANCEARAVEKRLFSTASGVRFVEGLDHAEISTIVHVQQDRNGMAARIVARRR